MKISHIKINNYRLLKEFSIDMEKLLSIVIGKNNTGKTSFLSILERFLNSEQNRFSFDDFNVDVQLAIKAHFDSNEEGFDFEKNKIFLRIYIEYGNGDSLSNISDIMLDLDPDIKQVILAFEYSLPKEKYLELKKDFNEFKIKLNEHLTERFAKENTTAEMQEQIRVRMHEKKNIIFFLKKNHARYFRIVKKGLEPNNESNFVDVTAETKLIDRIINFKRIKAKRDVANEDGVSKGSDRTLSKMSSKYYDKISGDDAELFHIVNLQNELGDTDERLNVVYEGLFENVIAKVKRFGGIKEDESKLMVISTLEDKNILVNNTTVMYEHADNHSLPEDYNGLGYMNLIAIIFEIEVLMTEFKRKKIREAVPADVNLLFIEEPEAHTHPQMQYVFIKNIKALLEDAANGTDDAIPFNLQTIITTHSSCITAESDFNDLKYFHRFEANKVQAKNLRHLQEQYTQGNPKDYQFLKQYLTLNRSELFFADKAIFIEGDTERLLLPAMMRKLDIEEPPPSPILPLLSQNISIVEVGAYSHIFEKFIEFLNIKTLIVTDLDTAKEETQKNKKGTDVVRRVKCKPQDATTTTNSALAVFFGTSPLATLTSYTTEQRVLHKNNDTWEQHATGRLCVTYQIAEEGYQARSFEDCFIHLNLQFIKDNFAQFRSLKNTDDIDDLPDAYEIADHCVDKKTLFALDILFVSDEKLSNWKIPLYIKEGLQWLQK